MSARNAEAGADGGSAGGVAAGLVSERGPCWESAGKRRLSMAERGGNISKARASALIDELLKAKSQ